MVPEVIHTYRECRVWAAPGPAVTPSVELPTKQNEFVECDIMFYKTNMIWHMIDRADRWHRAMLIERKTAEALCDAIDTLWISIHGPFKYLIIDRESGIDSEYTKTFLKRKGIQIRPRAVGQHAQYVERRGQIIRQTMHRIE